MAIKPLLESEVQNYPAASGSVVEGNATSGGRVDIVMSGITVGAQKMTSAADLNMRVDTATASVSFE